MRIYNSINVNRLLFLSLVIGSIGWVNLQTNGNMASHTGQAAIHAEDHRGSGRCDNGCTSSQSFDSTEMARRGSGRIDSNQST